MILPHCCHHSRFLVHEPSQLAPALLDHQLDADLVRWGGDVGRRLEDVVGVLDVPLGRGDGGEVEVEVFGDTGAVGGEGGDRFGVFGGEEEVPWLRGSDGRVLVWKPLLRTRYCVRSRG